MEGGHPSSLALQGRNAYCMNIPFGRPFTFDEQCERPSICQHQGTAKGVCVEKLTTYEKAETFYPCDLIGFGVMLNLSLMYAGPISAYISEEKVAKPIQKRDAFTGQVMQQHRPLSAEALELAWTVAWTTIHLDWLLDAERGRCCGYSCLPACLRLTGPRLWRLVGGATRRWRYSCMFVPHFSCNLQGMAVWP